MLVLCSSTGNFTCLVGLLLVTLNTLQLRYVDSAATEETARQGSLMVIGTVSPASPEDFTNISCLAES